MKKILIALDCYSSAGIVAANESRESIPKSAKNLHGNIVVRGSRNRKWLEKYQHGKCYGRSFASYFNSASRLSIQSKKVNIVVILKQGYPNRVPF